MDRSGSPSRLMHNSSPSDDNTVLRMENGVQRMHKNWREKLWFEFQRDRVLDTIKLKETLTAEGLEFLHD